MRKKLSPTLTWGNPFENQLNNDNNDSVSPYLDVNLKNDDDCETIEEEGESNGKDELAMMHLPNITKSQNIFGLLILVQVLICASKMMGCSM